VVFSSWLLAWLSGLFWCLHMFHHSACFYLLLCFMCWGGCCWRSCQGWETFGSYGEGGVEFHSVLVETFTPLLWKLYRLLLIVYTTLHSGVAQKVAIVLQHVCTCASGIMQKWSCDTGPSRFWWWRQSSFPLAIIPPVVSCSLCNCNLVFVMVLVFSLK